MDLRQLNALLTVAEHRSFSAAARALHTVQSNVSTHVARLESELGSQLIDRSRGELTAEGEIVADRARRILGELRSIELHTAARVCREEASASQKAVEHTASQDTSLVARRPLRPHAAALPCHNQERSSRSPQLQTMPLPMKIP